MAFFTPTSLDMKASPMGVSFHCLALNYRIIADKKTVKLFLFPLTVELKELDRISWIN